MKYEAKRDLSFPFSPSCPDITYVEPPDSSTSPTYVLPIIFSKSDISLSLPADMLLPFSTSVDMIKLLSFGLSLHTNVYTLMVIPLHSWIPPLFTLLFCTNYLMSCMSFILIRAEIRGLGISLNLKQLACR